MISPSPAELPNTPPYTSLLPDGPEIPPHDPYMDALYGVGPDKPLGSLPLKTITNICGEDTQAVRDLSEQRGLTTLLQTGEECIVGGGALYVYDEIALGDLLRVNADVLQHAGRPATPSDFVDRVAKEVANRSDLFTLIAWAYQDPRPEYQRPPVPIGEQPRIPSSLVSTSSHWANSR